MNWGSSTHLSGLFGASNPSARVARAVACGRHNCCGSDGRRQQECVLSPCWRPCSRGRLRGESSLTPPSFRWLLVVLGLWSHHSCLCPCLRVASSLRLWVSCSMSSKDTLLGLGLTLIRYALTSILISCPSAKTLFPNKMLF